MTYLVADFLIRVKNAYQARRMDVVLPYSSINKAIGKLLVKEGYLAECKEQEEDSKKLIVGKLRYVRRKPVFHEVQIISKPSLRVYLSSVELGKIRINPDMTQVLSTNQGVITAKEAKQKKIGGELLFRIW